MLILTLFLFIPSALSGITADTSITYQVTEARVVFHAKTTFQRFDGVSENLTGSFNTKNCSFDFEFEAASLDTGNRRRNRHMREDYLETDRYPDISYSGKLINCPEFQDNETVAIVAGGTFSLHGTNQEIFINGEITPKGDQLNIEASWQILLSDYNIDRPSFLINRMQNELPITLKAVLVKSELPK
ncbi:MAG: YceI family protein [Balneolaceae bacterium]